MDRNLERDELLDFLEPHSKQVLSSELSHTDQRNGFIRDENNLVHHGHDDCSSFGKSQLSNHTEAKLILSTSDCDHKNVLEKPISLTNGERNTPSADINDNKNIQASPKHENHLYNCGHHKVIGDNKACISIDTTSNTKCERDENYVERIDHLEVDASVNLGSKSTIEETGRNSVFNSCTKCNVDSAFTQTLVHPKLGGDSVTYNNTNTNNAMEQAKDTEKRLHDLTKSTEKNPPHSLPENVESQAGHQKIQQISKTYQHSVSQAFDNGEHFGLHSNSDLHSVVSLPDNDNMDQGWAWVVLVAAVLANVITGGCCYMSGVIVPVIVDEVDPNLSNAAWVGAVNIFTVCMSGPLAGFLCNKVGVRTTTCVGGVLIFLGFLGASFSKTIGKLLLTHGITVGLGAGFTFNSVVVVVGQYFCRYRGFACGLLAAGAGAGMFLGGAFVSVLLQTFGLHGGYLVWGAFTLHMIPCGMLFRPSAEEQARNIEREIVYRNSLKGSQETTSGFNSMLSGINSVFSGFNRSMVSGVDGTHHHKRLPHKIPARLGLEVEKPLLKSVLHKEVYSSKQSVTTERSHYRSRLNSNTHKSTSTMHKPVQVCPSQPKASNKKTRKSKNLNGSSQNGHVKGSQRHDSTPSHFHSNTTISLPVPSSLNRSYNRQQSHMDSHSQLSHVSLRHSFRHSREYDNVSLSATLVSTLRPRDALTPRHALSSRNMASLMGSVTSVPVSLAMLRDDLSRMESEDIPYFPRVTFDDVLNKFIASMYLFRNRPFLIFLVANLGLALGESPMITYLPSYAMSRGTSSTDASFLFTFMGIGSMLGRILVGLVAGDSSVGPVILFAGCLGLYGLLCAISTLITSTVVEQMVFSGCLGVYSGALVPLNSLITIELLGIKDLGTGFGYLSAFQAIGYLSGPPLAGALVNAFGYSTSFLFAGFVLIAACVAVMLMTLLLGKQEDKEEADSLDNLEKALQKISDDEDSEYSDDDDDVHDDEDDNTEDDDDNDDDDDDDGENDEEAVHEDKYEEIKESSVK